MQAANSIGFLAVFEGNYWRGLVRDNGLILGSDVLPNESSLEVTTTPVPTEAIVARGLTLLLCVHVASGQSCALLFDVCLLAALRRLRGHVRERAGRQDAGEDVACAEARWSTDAHALDRVLRAASGFRSRSAQRTGSSNVMSRS